MIRINTKELLSKYFINNNGKWSHNGNKCIIQFSADWCTVCKPQEIILNELKNEHNNIDFLKVNVEEEYQLAEIFKIKNLPTIFICDKEIKQFSGLMKKSKLQDIIKEVFNYEEALK